MAFKLVYTSASKGLKEGSFGFCTVACSRKLSERTITALEAFSGYRRLFVDAERAVQNPIVYSHVLLDDGETTQRVLSRIADAGLDYSGRNNKIACHLILEHTELKEAGPAAFFTDPQLFEKRWEGAPKSFDKPFELPDLTSTVSSCEEWKKTTGDPGWAGVLASTVYTDRPVVLIVRPEQNVLALYQEALSLLSSAMRWQATFSTYYAKTPPGIQCQWKATILGSREAQTTRAIPNVLTLDLTAPMSSTPESVDSSHQASRLIDAARGAAATPTEVADSTFNKQTKRRRNDAVQTEVQKNDARLEEKNNAVPSLNETFARFLNYGRKLPLKNLFDPDEETWKRWRIVGVSLVGVLALVALIVVGMELLDGAGKKLQESRENAATQDNVSVDSETPDDSKEQSVVDNDSRTKESNVPSVSQDEKTSDPFTFEEENAKEQVDKGEIKSTDSKDFSNATATNEENKEKEEIATGTDLSELFRSPALTAGRRPDFLTQEEYQTTVDFQTLVADYKLTADFGVFQRKESKSKQTLNEETPEESQEVFSAALRLCKKFRGQLKVTCDLSSDQNKERQWLGSKLRTNRQEFNFANIASSNSAKIIFKTTNGDEGKSNGFLAVEIDSQGKLVFQTSDEETRNYFLRSCKLKWTIVLPDPEDSEKDFIVETQLTQFLKPCEFDLLKDSKIVSSIIELTNGGILPLAVPHALSNYDPIRNSKLSPALLVLLNPKATPGAFNVDSQMDDKKKSIVFVFKLKAENVDAFKIRLTRNSQVVRIENVFDDKTLYAELDEYFNRQPYPTFPYDSNVMSLSDKRQRASYEIESAQNRKITFDFYLVSTTGREQHDKSKYIFVGSASVTPKELDQKLK